MHAWQERLVQQARKWLSQQGNDRWLIVYDNYDDLRMPGINSATGYDIRTYFPFRSQGSILITTRSPQLAFAKRLPVTKLQDIDQSLAILATRSGRKIDGGRRKKHKQRTVVTVAYLLQTAQLNNSLDALTGCHWH